MRLWLAGFLILFSELLSAEDHPRIGVLERCRLAAKVLKGGAQPQPNQSGVSPYIPVDLKAFLGRDLTTLESLGVHFAPLFPPAFHANILYQRTLDAMKKPENAGKSIFEVSHQVMGHRVEVSEEDLARIPQEGGFLMISNHPTGVIDGDVDAYLLRQRQRDDFAIVVAHFLEPSLSAHPDLKDHFIYVDRRHRSSKDPKIIEEADARNRQELRRVISARKEGRIVILYPTGSIASKLPNPEHPVTYDGAWDPTTVTFARSMQVIVPTFKVIRNSDYYLELKSRSLPKSRQAYFAEALNKSGQTVEVIVGEPFTWADVEREVPKQPGVSEEDLTQARLRYIRSRVDQLDPYGLAVEFSN